MVASGFGITIMPQTAVKGSNFCNSCDINLVSIPLEGDGIMRTTALAWRVGFPRHKTIEAVRNAIYTSYNLKDGNKQLPIIGT